jgi:methylenetetrahydrofolate dehydrogenase (NADP+)/methenyltetrahydrofolate cyclohydrolase
MTRIIDGKSVARGLRKRIAEEVTSQYRPEEAPGLATVLVGDDPASATYVASKRRAVAEVGMRDLHRHLEADASQEEIGEVLDGLAEDPSVDGILLQLPLPPGLDIAALVDRIPASKDVDGLTTTSAGLLARGLRGLRPCTPSGVISLLEEEGVPLEGAGVVVVGRSELVGKPMAQLLLQRNATVTIAHSRTRDLEAVTSAADILVVAAGAPGLIGREHVKRGAVVMDVGIHRADTGLVGDVRADEVLGVAERLTPVPGGVGPMTIAVLLENALRAAQWSR